jgi:hypothetical protein
MLVLIFRKRLRHSLGEPGGFNPDPEAEKLQEAARTLLRVAPPGITVPQLVQRAAENPRDSLFWTAFSRLFGTLGIN